jgi:uncharacterized protein
MRRPLLILPLLLLPLCTLLPSPAQGGEVPFLNGRVNDAAGMLSLDATGKLNALLKAHEDSTSNQVVVLTIRSLEGDDLESYSVRVAETWKLGQKGKDNGVLLLIVKDERKVRIEVGRGLEGNLPDITCGTIIRKEIVPRFKSGDFDGGTIAGVEAILAAINGAYVAEAESSGAESLVAGIIGFGIFFLVVGIFTLVAIFAKGFLSWFLYAFLTPFWYAFPMGFLGDVPGKVIFFGFLIGFPIVKIWLRGTKGGKAFIKRTSQNSFFGTMASGGWSSSSSGGSSSSFSGGGGSFSGGGASGSW